MKIKVCTSQYSYIFGNDQVHFPYSIASLISYAKTNAIIDDAFEFEKTFLLRDKVEEDIEKAKDAYILACSCYCWNWEITTYLAKRVKEINHKCFIVFGGPEVPDILPPDFFEKHPYIDMVVHGEGEETFKEILGGWLISSTRRPYEQIKGTETKKYKGEPRPRMTNLDVIPSPYSSDLVWDLVDKDVKLHYIASWETNRGCPFQCTFCDWGSSTKTKLRNFSEEKLFKEIEWFGKNNIKYVDCCDGNFGIYAERDFSLCEKLTETKKQTGFPEKIGLTWVKTSSEKIIPLAKKLQEGNLLRAVSLSVQSLDDNTLKIIKRKNIKFDEFGSLVKRFEDENIQAYTELIMGLPGETLKTYKNNWEILASIYPLPSIMTWNCSVFVNAPMNEELYKQAHGIKTFVSPVFLAHTEFNKAGKPEYERMVNETTNLPDKTIHDVYIFNWAMLVFHSFGVMEYIARYINKEYGISYVSFYESFLEYCKQKKDTLFGQEYQKIVEHARKGYNGEGWDHYDPSLGNISWPFEEASWLRVIRDKITLLYELELFVLGYFQNEFNIDDPKLIDLIGFQAFVNNTPSVTCPSMNKYKYNWKEYFVDNKPLTFEDEIWYAKTPIVENGDNIQWGYESIWFGRRDQRYKTKLKDLERKKWKSIS